MDYSTLKRPCVDTELLVDRISNLPDELLVGILSLLTTKEAYVTSVVSKRTASVLPWLTSLEFIDSPFTHCLVTPNRDQRFLAFSTFVDTVLRSSLCQNLSRFRLLFGPYDQNERAKRRHTCRSSTSCFPDLNHKHVDTWICFPLTRNIRELDFTIYVKNPGSIPPSIFTCETLEVLKIDTNLDANQVSNMTNIHLPNLKLLHIYRLHLPRDDFLTRLVSGCPVLENLHVDATWDYADFITICSTSLRILKLNIMRPDDSGLSSQVFRIDTPNLERLFLFENLSYCYSITHMNSLVQVSFEMWFQIICHEEASLPSVLNFLRAVSNVKHLTLIESFFEVLDMNDCSWCKVLDTGDLKSDLPLFHKLSYLEFSFGGAECNFCYPLLLAFLKNAPFLEVFVFEMGRYHSKIDITGEGKAKLELERQRWISTPVIPSCCQSHLKRIVINRYYGLERDLELVKYFLRNSLILEELIIYCLYLDKESLRSTLHNLPRASMTCSIIVQ